MKAMSLQCETMRVRRALGGKDQQSDASLWPVRICSLYGPINIQSAAMSPQWYDDVAASLLPGRLLATYHTLAAQNNLFVQL